MIASLPMYSFAQTKAAETAFWVLVRDHLRKQGVPAPKNLNETKSPYDVWGAPDLVLSHICHLPYRLHFREEVTRIGASDFGLEGCPPGHYRSLFIVRDDHPAQEPLDLDGAKMALNSSDSHSGWGDAATWALQRGIRFRPTVWTASHDNSLGAVVAGQADFATIDARTFEILKLIRAEAQMVRVIGATAPSPCMTFITAGGTNPTPHLAALRHAIDALEPRHADTLGLKGIVDMQRRCNSVDFITYSPTGSTLSCMT
jgi:hypothetical protein